MLKKAIPLVLVAMAASCQSAQPVNPAAKPYLSGSAGNPTSVLGATVAVQIDTGATLTTLAAKKTTADIDHYHLKLVDANTGVVIAEGDSNGLTSHFNNVPNGTYRLIADAIDADGNSIVQGGEQTSINTVTVNSPNVTYSDGSPCLKVTLHLLDATGETVGNKVHVIDGQDWTGPANLVDGGDCPCPSPSPTSTTITCDEPVPGTPITTGVTTYNSTYAPYNGDIFAGSRWNSGTNGSAWINREFNGTYTVAGYRFVELASDPNFGPASSIVVKLRTPDGTWVTVDSLTNTNFYENSYIKTIQPPITATAMRVDISGHGWFGGICAKVWSPPAAM